MLPDSRGTVVSLTPLALERDSRTFRIAHSLAEAGWRSVVIEGEPSAGRFWGDDIEVRSLGASQTGRRDMPPADALPADPRYDGSRARSGTISRLREGAFGRGGEWALYAAYRGYDLWHYRLSPAGIIPRADLYYLHSFELHRAVARLAGRRAPIIYDAHDFYRGIEPPELQPSFDRRRLRPFLNRLEERLVAQAAAIVTVSDGVAGLIERTFRRRPVVIRNCHDERHDRPIDIDLRAKLRLSPVDRLCVVVGNRKRGMALDEAVAAFATLPPRFHLAFVGRGYEADRAQIAGTSLAARIHFGHSVPPNQVVPFIRSADIGLVIYRQHSENYRMALPNGFFQMLAAGLPIVRGSLPEIEAAIGARGVGLCLERLEAAGLAQAILRSAEDAASLRTAAAALGHELRWESEACRLLRLVDGVLPSRAGEPRVVPAVAR